MKIIFIGCVKSSKVLLEALVKCNIDIVGVVTKQNSSFNSDFYDLSKVCSKYELEYIYCDDINSEEITSYIKDKKPDFIYCFGWSQLIKKNILSIPNKGCIGFHPAELPKNRGRHPIIWALVLGLKETASTFFFLEDDADSGDIISQEKIIIDDIDDAQSLYDKILDVASNQVVKFTEELCKGSIRRVTQEGNKTNYWRKRNKEDGKIDWRMSSKSIYNLVRALTKPYVGAHFVNNNKEIKVWSTKIVDYNIDDNIEPGKVIKVIDRKCFYIKTGDGVILIDNYENYIIKEGDYLI